MSTLDTAWFLHCHIIPNLGLFDLNTIEECLPLLLGPSCRREKEKKKNLQIVVYEGPIGFLKIYARNFQIAKFALAMAGVRFAA